MSKYKLLNGVNLLNVRADSLKAAREAAKALAITGRYGLQPIEIVRVVGSVRVPAKAVWKAGS